ncbi:MAG: Mor transcription activator family protein [Gallionellaceae bacterium]
MKCGESVLKFMETTLRQVMGPDRFTEADALEFKLRVSREFGGGPVYIPKVEKDARREAVIREFNGRNRKELCDRLGLSKAQFYRYLKGD